MNPTALLTDREIEVIECAARDMSVFETSVRMFVSPETVKTHRRHILRKLGCVSMTGAVGKWQAEGVK